MDMADEAVPFHELLVGGRPVSGVRPDAARRVGLVEKSIGNPSFSLVRLRPPHCCPGRPSQLVRLPGQLRQALFGNSAQPLSEPRKLLKECVLISGGKRLAENNAQTEEFVTAGSRNRLRCR
jgi:hypothetical protein